MWLRPSFKGVQGDLGTSGTGGWRARAVYVGDSPGKPKSLEAAGQAGVGSTAIAVVSGSPGTSLPQVTGCRPVVILVELVQVIGEPVGHRNLC